MSSSTDDMDVKNIETTETTDEQPSQSAENSNNRSKRNTKNKQPQSAVLNKLEARVADLEKERDELKDLLLRKAAEFDNFKKRTESDFSQLIESANAELIVRMLPVLDDFDRFLNAADEKEDLSSLKEGLDLIFKKFGKAIEESGVKPITAVGEEFDPEKHEALMQVDSEEYPSGTVVDEHLKGYIMNDRVLRHSQVLVSR